MEYTKIREKIEKSRDFVEFGRYGSGVSEDWIKNAEKRLNCLFPPSYVWWLKNYGGGEINGDEIFSIYEIDFDKVIGGDIVYINELNRKNGSFSEDKLVLQENDFGEVYYFDLSQKNEQKENPIYLNTTGKKYADDFIDFLFKKMNE